MSESHSSAQRAHIRISKPSTFVVDKRKTARWANRFTDFIRKAQNINYHYSHI